MYASGKQTYIQLAERFHCSTKTIQRMLDKAPVVKRKEFSCVAVVIMDTTYFGRGFGVMVFKNSLDGMVLYKQYVGYETNALYLSGIFEIRRRGIAIQGIVCDGRQGLFGVFDDIRQLFAQVPESKIRGYKPGRFSFNVTGGRCEECGGAGVKAIEMNFLPDVYVTCDKCNGKRYNAETLEIRYKGKSINDVLEMDIDTALAFFEGIHFIVQKLKTLAEVGLGYIRLGQPSTTLSGGEAQRVKLAAELSKKDTGSTFYILDEPTTGLHFHDIAILMDLLNRFVDKGNTVLVIEHNMEVIKMADHIIDMGPEGGRYGGEIIATGTPEEIVKQGKGFTWKYLETKI